MRLNLNDLRALAGHRKLSSLTCYDASFAEVLDEAGVDILLVGDSLGMVIQGHDTTLPVSVEDMAYHTRAVVRGSRRALVMADMPFGSYQESPAQALRHAVQLMQCGAHLVKLEGGEEIAATVAFLVERGVPVCGHVGLTPQHVNVFGGYRVQGRGAAGAERVRAAARALEAAGAALLVIEAVPEPLAADLVAQTRGMLTIGIGASPHCHGQVLVLHDMLGVHTGKRPRFVRNFLVGTGSVREAVRNYVADVQAGRFPQDDHLYREQP